MAIAKAFNLDEKKVLLVMNGVDRNALLSVRNAPNALMMQAIDLNTYALLNNDAILETEDSVAVINEF